MGATSLSSRQVHNNLSREGRDLLRPPSNLFQSTALSFQSLRSTTENGMSHAAVIEHVGARIYINIYTHMMSVWPSGPSRSSEKALPDLKKVYFPVKYANKVIFLCSVHVIIH